MSYNQTPFFVISLCPSLKLESDGKTAEVLAGDLESIYLNLHPYGHHCKLLFSTVNDTDIYEMFTAPKKIDATFSLKPVDPLDGTDPLLEIKGIVTHKSFKRNPARDGEIEKTYRLYEISFSDHAKVIWEEHHPINVYVDESMKDILEKHVNPDINLKYEWDPLTIKHPITAFSLEYKAGQPANRQVSFYSFLMWYLHQENGILLYDYKENSYKFTGKKEKPADPPLKVLESQVMPPVYVFPLPSRYNGKTIKHTADSTENDDQENPDSFKFVRREQIDASNYRVYPEQAEEKVESVLTSEKAELFVEFTIFNKELHLGKIIPGSLLTFLGDLADDNWSEDPCFKGKNFRVRHLYFEANKQGVSDEIIERPDQPYQIYAKAELELEEETFVSRPNFNPPSYPFYIQGKVFSDIGDKEQSTFKILETQEVPEGQYQVLVPLAGEGKMVVAPFVPAYSGQFYYPFYKDTRVMLEMHFRTAKIDRPIDWNPLVRLPKGVQGNQIVLSSNGKDKFTILRQEFLDGKEDVFTIVQSSSDKQTQTIQIKEKDLLFKMMEKDKKTVSIQLNHESGLTLNLEDNDTSMTQQTIFDGKAMMHTCKGSEGTSTIVQKPDSIAIDCKEFIVKSDNITFDAKDKISNKGANKIHSESSVCEVSAPTIKLG